MAGSNPATLPFHVLINADSGTARTLGQEKIENIFGETEFKSETFHFLPADEFNKKIQELVESPHPVLIGGGDGTILKTAALHLEHSKPFAILPFGTMNLLAQDLKIPLALSDSLSAYKNKHKVVGVDVGLVNGHAFLCCAAWGTMPEAAEFREKHRNLPDFLLMPRLTSYIMSRMDITKNRNIRLTLDSRSQSIRTAMLVVSNNMYDPQSPRENFVKDSLQNGTLGVYIVTPHGLINKIKLLVRLKQGSWKSDPSMQEFRAANVVLETAEKKELLSLDGEPIELEAPFKFSVKRAGVKIIIPESSFKESQAVS